MQIGSYSSQEDQYGDDRLPVNTLVVGVEVGGQFKGYPADTLSAEGGVVNDTLAQTGLAYSREVNGQVLEFYNASSQGVELRDRETDSLWELQDRAISSPLTGKPPTFVPSFISEWYGWSAYIWRA